MGVSVPSLHRESTDSLIYIYIYIYIYICIKNIFLMLKDVGMAVPKTKETRCRDGSVQARHVIQRLHN